MKAMKCIFVLTCLLVCAGLSAQQKVPQGFQQIQEDGTYLVAEQMPEFPGGMDALMKYLGSNIKYPKSAQEKAISGRVIVSFVVDVDGSLKNMKVVRGVDPALDEEAVRVISTMPLWNPGKDKGKEVPVKYTIPISFSLTPPNNNDDDGFLLIPSDAGIKNQSLKAIWQLCRVVKNSDGSFKLFPQPVLKDISGDKTFTNLFMSVKKYPSIIPVTGKYELKSNNLYVEIIDKEKSMPEFSAWDKNEITYEFLHDNLVKFQFTVPANNKEMIEYWYRTSTPKSQTLMAD